MNQQFRGYENYPLWSVLIDNLVSYSTALVGIYLLLQIHSVLAAIFFLFVVYNEYSIYKEGCAGCYYYGKVCHSGKGKIAPFLVKKGDPKMFTERSPLVAYCRHMCQIAFDESTTTPRMGGLNGNRRKWCGTSSG